MAHQWWVSASARSDIVEHPWWVLTAALAGLVTGLAWSRWRHQVVRELQAIRELMERFFRNGEDHR